MIYPYRREDGTYFEVEQDVKTYTPLTECPETGQKCHRVYNVPHLQFAGAGWPGIEASDKYTTFTRHEDGSITRKK